MTESIQPPPSSQADKSAFRARLTEWFRKYGRDLPWRNTADPYAILVSEFMLQQTQVGTVLGFYSKWMKRFPNWQSLAAANEQDVLSLWQGLGYYSRARNLHATAKIVCSRYEGNLPVDPREMQALPGIGRYTAGAVATFAFDLPKPAVDANVERVLARITAFRQPVDTAHGKHFLNSVAAGFQPSRDARTFNAALMELGAIICLPRRPDCPRCPVRTFCMSYREGDPAQLPVKAARAAVTTLTEHRSFVHHDNHVLLQQEQGPRWRGLWRLPDSSPEYPLIHSLAYSITRYRITMHVRIAPRPGDILSNQSWFSSADLQRLPMPSPHRRALNAALAIDKKPSGLTA